MQQKAILFPGQGSQKVGMLSALADSSIIQETFSESAAVLGYDVWQTCQSDPDGVLDQTQVTQPCLLTANIALWRQALADKTFSLDDIAYIAGHSLGEYAALVAAEVMSFTDALILVSHRGRLMQSAVAEGVGAMSAVIGLPGEKVAELCDRVAGQVQAANYNSAQQTVVSGERDAVIALNELAKAEGAKLVKLLAVSVAAHSQLMASIVDEFYEHLIATPMQAPTLQVVANVDVNVYNGVDSVVAGLRQQLTGAVHWYESIEFMVARGVGEFYECGPNRVLSGLNKRIVKACSIHPLSP